VKRERVSVDGVDVGVQAVGGVGELVVGVVDERHVRVTGQRRRADAVQLDERCCSLILLLLLLLMLRSRRQHDSYRTVNAASRVTTSLPMIHRCPHAGDILNTV